MCQGFNNLSDSLHHFVLAKLATTSVRVKMVTDPHVSFLVEQEMFFSNQSI